MSAMGKGYGWPAKMETDTVRDIIGHMLLDYIRIAMGLAHYEMLPDGEGFFSRIEGFDGLWAQAATLESCREELQSTLQEWLLVKLRHNDTDLPIVGGIDLNPRREVA
jgi:predicted RNase H-like HicB family nuclease